ncbi:helix-turn-helix transcriptional regulator [Sphingomonas aquatilis]|uniref:DNA-binding transcriptional regulator YafY n=1 Tax=Sphingomonas aquatilis TaxID=93063 RepID=A0AAW3TYP6_9SPHN|nr:WYL domain-containing protein [Sphingomonas aquatilis]MBB3877010.1 putative DNA-binding transcriptional regulator YafY [Sphingomonas aquatilis]
MSFSKAVELVRLAQMATRRSGVTLNDIADEFGCSHRTAQRMTEALESAFPQTERRIGDDARARWSLPVRAVAPLLTPSPDELASLVAAIAELDQAGMTREAATARRLERKVRALIPPEVDARLAVDEEAMLEALGHAARPGPRPANLAAVDDAIYDAIKGLRLLRILYRRRDEDEPRERVVAPHGLLLGVRRYLVALDVAKTGGRLQHYRVEEIYEAVVLDEGFVMDSGFSIQRHAERGFGSFESEAQHGEVIWRFSPNAAPHARRYVFHPTQRLEDEADGSLLVRFMASGHLEMCWHLYAWGSSVEVIAPEALRRLVDGHRRDFEALP